MLATAILDRLLHHSTTINIKGESFRLKEKKRAGMFSGVKEVPREEQPPEKEKLEEAEEKELADALAT